MKDAKFVEDISKPECPFNGAGLHQPENRLQAYCDQLHSDLLLLWGSAQLANTKERASLAKAFVKTLKVHVAQVEGMIMEDVKQHE